jgi:hypothetical protein
MTTALLMIVFCLGFVSGGVSMFLVGICVKARFEEEAERRKQGQPEMTVLQKNVELDLARVGEVGVDAALRERARQIAILN